MVDYLERLNELIEEKKWTEIPTLISELVSELNTPHLTDNIVEELNEIIGILKEYGYLELVVDLKRAYVQRTNDDSVKLSLAGDLIDLHLHDEALSLLYDYTEDSDYYRDALVLTSDLYQSEGDLEIALAKLNQAQDIDFESPLALSQAELAFQLHDLSAANRYLSTIDANDLDAQLNLYAIHLKALIASESGDLAKARSILEATDFDQLTEAMQVDLLTLYDLDENYDKIIDLTADEVKTYAINWLLAKAYSAVHEYEKAITLLENMIAENPDDKLARLLLVNDYLSNHQKDKATALIQKLLIDFPHDFDVLQVANDQLVLDENYEEVVQLLSPLSDGVDLPSELSLLLAKAYVETDEIEKANSLFKTLYPVMSDDVSFIEEYALFLRNNGFRDELKTVINNAREDNLHSEELLLLAEEVSSDF